MADSFDIMISEFLDGGKTGAGSRRLGEKLTSDKKLRKEFLDQLLMHQLLSEYFGEKKGAVKPQVKRRSGWLRNLWKSLNGALRPWAPSSN